MTCYSPIRAYLRISELPADLKEAKAIIFRREEAYKKAYKPIELPCNNCIGCKMDKSKDWALRCILESKCWENNIFITLTMNEENVTEQLDKSMFQKFIKRLRKEHDGIEFIQDKDGRQKNPIRYFYCGEYGENFSRPHFHALLFNFDFGDKILWRVDKGNRIYRSESLEELWPFGFSEIGDVTYESAAYVARYVTKKLNGYDKQKKLHYSKVDNLTGELLGVKEEFIDMSRRPGIGKIWFEKFTNDIKKDHIYINGMRHKIPKYFDKLLSDKDPVTMARNKERRSRNALLRTDGKTLKRLGQKREHLEMKTKRLERDYENATI